MTTVIPFDFDALHRIETEFIDVHKVIARNKTAFEDRFLNSNRYYNQINNPATKSIHCLVFKEYPDVSRNIEEYTISYDEFYTWMHNIELFKFMDAK